MNTDAIIHIGRAIERLGLIALAGYAVYFGFRLFYIAQRHSGIIELQKGEWQLKLSRVAPGVCFGLFGVALACTVAFSSVETKSKSPDPASGAESVVIRRNLAESDDAAVRTCRAIGTIERAFSITASTTNSVKGALQEMSRLKNRLAIDRFGEDKVRYYKENVTAFQTNAAQFTDEQRDSLAAIYDWLGTDF